MSASYTRTDRVLSIRERESFKREIEARRRTLNGQLVITHVNGAGSEGMSERRKGRWDSFVDPSYSEDSAMLNSQIRHMQKQLDKGSPRNLTRRERSQLEKQVAEDREYFRKHMVPKDRYYKRSNDPEFEKVTQEVLKNEVASKEFQKRASRFKNNMRELDSENPNSSNLESLRPER